MQSSFSHARLPAPPVKIRMTSFPNPHFDFLRQNPTDHVQEHFAAGRVSYSPCSHSAENLNLREVVTVVSWL